MLDSYSPLRHESHRANRGGSITPTKNVVCIQTSHNQPDRAKWILYTVNRIVAYTTLEFLGALCELFSLKNSLNHCRIKRFKPTKKKRVLLLKLNSISLEKFGERELLLHVRLVNSIMLLKFPDYFALTALAPFSRTLASSPMTPIFSPTLGPPSQNQSMILLLEALKKKNRERKIPPIVSTTSKLFVPMLHNPLSEVNLIIIMEQEQPQPNLNPYNNNNNNNNNIITKKISILILVISPPSCHAPLPKIRENRIAMRVGDVYTRGKYPTYTRQA